MRQLLELVVGQIELLEKFKLAEDVHDDVQVFDLLVLEIKESCIRLVLQILVDHVLEVLLAD